MDGPRPNLHVVFQPDSKCGKKKGPSFLQVPQVPLYRSRNEGTASLADVAIGGEKETDFVKEMD